MPNASIPVTALGVRLVTSRQNSPAGAGEAIDQHPVGVLVMVGWSTLIFKLFASSLSLQALARLPHFRANGHLGISVVDVVCCVALHAADAVGIAVAGEGKPDGVLESVAVEEAFRSPRPGRRGGGAGVVPEAGGLGLVFGWPRVR